MRTVGLRARLAEQLLELGSSERGEGSAAEQEAPTSRRCDAAESEGRRDERGREERAKTCAAHRSRPPSEARGAGARGGGDKLS
eukprot:scaffold170281_cov29-Tisochrysis_lutea.AAC.1